MKEIVTLSETNLHVKQIENCPLAIGYFPNERYIAFNLKKLKQLHLQDYSSISFEQMISSFVLHEIGHHLDSSLQETIERRKKYNTQWRNTDVPEGCKQHPYGLALKNKRCLSLIIQEEQLTKDIEETAWNIGFSINKQWNVVSIEAFNFVRKKALESYTIWLEKAQQIAREMEAAITA